MAAVAGTMIVFGLEDLRKLLRSAKRTVDVANITRLTKL